MWEIEYDNDACERQHADDGPYHMQGGAEEDAKIHNRFCIRGGCLGDCASVTRLSATAQADHERRRRVEVDV